MVPLFVCKGVSSTHAAPTDTDPLKVVRVDQPQRQRPVINLVDVFAKGK